MTIRRTCAFKGFTNAFWLNTIDIIYSKSGRQVVSNTESLSFFKIGFLWGGGHGGVSERAKYVTKFPAKSSYSRSKYKELQTRAPSFSSIRKNVFKRSLQRVCPRNKRPRNNLIDFILKTYLFQIIPFPQTCKNWQICQVTFFAVSKHYLIKFKQQDGEVWAWWNCYVGI